MPVLHHFRAVQNPDSRMLRPWARAATLPAQTGCINWFPEDTEGPQVHPAFVERMRQWRPRLPTEPTADQLEAWIELADLMQDEDSADRCARRTRSRSPRASRAR